MYSSLTIRRFRCFRELKLEGLRRVNLVTGLNNVGKTTLLEALFLLVGGFNPSLPWRVNTLRGMETLVGNPEDQWGWLFHNHEINQDIEIVAADTDGGTDTLRVHLGSAQEFERITKGQRELPVEISRTLPILQAGAEIPSTRLPVELSDLILDFHEHRGKTVVSRASLASDGRIRLDQTKQNGFRPGAFLATRIRTAAEDSDRLSRLKRQKRDKQVVDVLRATEPNLNDLTILAVGGEFVIHAEVNGVGLIPVPMLGEGVGRLLSLTLTVLTTPGGIVLVDEIENGVHHSALRRVWRGLATAALDGGTQLVATTHSAECIRAADEAARKGDSYDLALIRLDRVEGEIKATVMGEETMRTAKEFGWELR